MKRIVWKGHQSGGPFHLLGIPGHWTAGIEVPIEQTGKTASEWRRIIAQHPGCEIEIVDIEPAKKPARTTGTAKAGSPKEG